MCKSILVFVIKIFKNLSNQFISSVTIRIDPNWWSLWIWRHVETSYGVRPQRSRTRATVMNRIGISANEKKSQSHQLNAIRFRECLYDADTINSLISWIYYHLWQICMYSPLPTIPNPTYYSKSCGSLEIVHHGKMCACLLHNYETCCVCNTFECAMVWVKRWAIFGGEQIIHANCVCEQMTSEQTPDTNRTKYRTVWERQNNSK